MLLRHFIALNILKTFTCQNDIDMASNFDWPIDMCDILIKNKIFVQFRFLFLFKLCYLVFVNLKPQKPKTDSWNQIKRSLNFIKRQRSTKIGYVWEESIRWHINIQHQTNIEYIVIAQKKLLEMVRQSVVQSKPEAAFLCAYYVQIVELTT